ncbi:hypothetical protein ACFPPA_07740 [Rhodanobacter ginsengisoli]|uniref:Uncharacterized protein n=1 Tax=Rhodanobacter ginsengisoli TaxID=418646 RepID=A0ABW0QMW8_9GAMM
MDSCRKGKRDHIAIACNDSSPAERRHHDTDENASISARIRSDGSTEDLPLWIWHAFGMDHRGTVAALGPGRRDDQRLEQGERARLKHALHAMPQTRFG